MSRKTRLHELLQVMRQYEGRIAGPSLAEALGISIRTLYQDIAALRAVGIDIASEPGVGYVLAPGQFLPPLAISDEELEALVTGLERLGENSLDPLAMPAKSLLESVRQVLPDARQQPATPSTEASIQQDVGDQGAPLVFYTNPLSRGGIVHWMLEELGVSYRMVTVEYGPAMKTPEFLAINPMGKVPVLCHGDVVITESAAICAYLADAFPEAGLAPPPAERGDYYRWLFFAAGPMESALGLYSLGVQPTAEQSMRLGCGAYSAVMDTLASTLQGRRYLVGDRFSAADIYVGSHIGWGMQFGTLPARPEFQAYWAGLCERPAQQQCQAFVAEALAHAR
ncbi:glutathione S-transferase N-terminal domain-containing protein [Halomonas urumqiensis]|uniref:Transcriptional regulator n=1 Tax=Halomonas urumqiensis TaxID=1684789 RepID=A0A2N7UFD2_9GAMM|nr:glutathione S-transferase N-terminal domain-containing protein [Halomonas urumqiensis]PMR79178.1 transcriptional regulator [Halomonas urumqiensis]PTB03853.1 HTH domain-containing protein [Halomonas urumqiensis]GHE19911.1 hypothetical protein GCM10017767_04320 [Halomonas urumqiensis]